MKTGIRKDAMFASNQRTKSKILRLIDGFNQRTPLPLRFS
jgi:hypothetical protein